MAFCMTFRQNPCQPPRNASVAKCVAAFTATSACLLRFEEKMLQNRTPTLAFSTTVKGNLGQRKRGALRAVFLQGRCFPANQPAALPVPGAVPGPAPAHTRPGLVLSTPALGSACRRHLRRGGSAVPLAHPG